jgi:GGDEF domain-containing protein
MVGKGTAQAGRNAGVSDVVRQIRAERIRFFVMRLSFLIVTFIALAFLIWVAPSLPWGASADDYTPASAASLILCLIAWIGSVAFILAWMPRFRGESFPQFLRVLFGARQFIRGRQQFQSRLATECRQTRRDRRHAFSVVVLQVAPAPKAETGQDTARDTALAAVAVRAGVRSHDIVAEVMPDEVWVLAFDAAAEGRKRVVERLARALLESHASLGPTRSYRIGAGTFGEDGENPESLLAAAHEQTRSLAELLDAVPAAA